MGYITIAICQVQGLRENNHASREEALISVDANHNRLKCLTEVKNRPHRQRYLYFDLKNDIYCFRLNKICHDILSPHRLYHKCSHRYDNSSYIGYITCNLSHPFFFDQTAPSDLLSSQSQTNPQNKHYHLVVWLIHQQSLP